MPPRCASLRRPVVRDAFIRELTSMAAADPDTILITGDLGFGVLTEFSRRFPRQYINAGVAEQNMTALAVGLALEGKTVYTYSIGNFPTLRCLEQVRNDACYHQANVKIVAIGGGFAYGALGISHHATEDLAVMRALPNMTVFCPGDPVEVALVTRAAQRTPGTCYLRLGRGGEASVHVTPPEFTTGKAITLHSEGDVALLSAGGILAVAAVARTDLAARGVQAALYSLPTLKPFDAELVCALARTRRLIVTIEEHSSLGGLGGAVSEIVAEMPGRAATVLRCGLESKFTSIVGSQNYLRARYGLDAPSIVDRVLQHLKTLPSPCNGLNSRHHGDP